MESTLHCGYARRGYIMAGAQILNRNPDTRRQDTSRHQAICAAAPPTSTS